MKYKVGDIVRSRVSLYAYTGHLRPGHILRITLIDIEQSMAQVRSVRNEENLGWIRFRSIEHVRPKCMFE